MKRLSVLLPFAFSLFLSACLPNTQPVSDASSSSASSVPVSSSASSLDLVTHGVTYQGVIQPAGISIYQEGTHRLNMDSGVFVLLESNTVDLDSYVGKHVTVVGDQRPTVEAGGTIVDVQLVTEDSSGASDSSASASALSVSSVDASSVASASSVSAAASSSSNISSSSSSKSSSSSSVTSALATSSVADDTSSSAVSGADASAALQKRIDAMAKYKSDAASWSQQYCSSHIGFCVSLQKNVYYKSFGATDTALWHTEVSSEEINVLGDGPLSIDLVSGTVEAAGGTDGAVETRGDNVVGYRAWTNNTHFEISAPAKLKALVDYMTKSLAVQAK